MAQEVPSVDTYVPPGVQVCEMGLKSAKFCLKSAPLPPGPPKNRPKGTKGSIGIATLSIFLGVKFQHQFQHAFFFLYF